MLDIFLRLCIPKIAGTKSIFGFGIHFERQVSNLKAASIFTINDRKCFECCHCFHSKPDEVKLMRNKFRLVCYCFGCEMRLICVCAICCLCCRNKPSSRFTGHVKALIIITFRLRLRLRHIDFESIDAIEYVCECECQCEYQTECPKIRVCDVQNLVFWFSFSDDLP